MFRPRCGSILMPKNVGGKKVLACSCGYNSTDVSSMKIKEEVKDTGHKVEVIDKEIEVMPLVDIDCSKCKHKRAYFWEIQTRASDEPATKFYKCEKCKHIWRDYK